MKMIELQHKNIKEKNRYCTSKLHLYYTNENYKLQCTLDVYIYRRKTYLEEELIESCIFGLDFGLNSEIESCLVSNFSFNWF
jgi:hypothetical protein